MKIIWSPLALDRTSEIAEYIALDNPEAAKKWIDNIFKKVVALQVSSEIGRIVPEIGRKEIRELISGNYRIIYRLGNASIYILTVRHSKQILPIEELIA